MPVRNFQGDIVVLIRYVYPTHYFSKIAYVKKSSALICLFGLIACSLILDFLFSMITGRIHKLVSETEKLRAMVLDGTITITPATLRPLMPSSSTCLAAASRPTSAASGTPPSRIGRTGKVAPHPMRRLGAASFSLCRN